LPTRLRSWRFLRAWSVATGMDMLMMDLCDTSCGHDLTHPWLAWSWTKETDEPMSNKKSTLNDMTDMKWINMTMNRTEHKWTLNSIAQCWNVYWTVLKCVLNSTFLLFSAAPWLLGRMRTGSLRDRSRVSTTKRFTRLGSVRGHTSKILA
jgi:hypothetical protein